MSIDAIILAAGNGSRLAGIAATGLKPLLVVNGEALITRLVRQARAVIDGKVIVVTSPVNTQHIVDLVGPDVSYVVQPTPAGPGDALLRALEVADADKVLVLMGDNHMDDDDMATVMASKEGVGIRVVSEPEAARRFTRVSALPTGLATEEGPLLNTNNGPPWKIWCGPLLVERDRCRTTLLRYRPISAGEFKIGPYLEHILSKDAATVMVNTRDVGIPEELG